MSLALLWLVSVHAHTCNTAKHKSSSEGTKCQHFSFVFCLFILHQSCLTIIAGTANCPILGGIGFQSTPPLEGAGVFNVPEGDSPQNTEPPFIA